MDDEPVRVLATDQARSCSRVVENRSLVGLIQEPRQLSDGFNPAVPNLVLGNVVPAFHDTKPDAFDIEVGRSKHHKNKPELERTSLRLDHQPPIFVRR